MKVNLTLILIGVAFLAAGLYRTFPLQADKGFYLNNVPIWLILIGLIGWSCYAGGIGFLQNGLRNSIKVTSQFFPMLAAIMLVMGFSVIFTKYYEATFTKFLAGRFGFIGVFGAAVGSPSSLAFAKFVEGLWPNPQVRVQLLYLLTAVPLVSYNLFLIRQMGLGPEIAAVMYKTNFAVAIGLLPFFYIWSKIVAR